MTDLENAGRLFITSEGLGELFIEANEVPDKKFNLSMYAYGTYPDRLPNQLKLIGHFSPVTEEDVRKSGGNAFNDPLNHYVFLIDNGDNSIIRFQRKQSNDFN